MEHKLINSIVSSFFENEFQIESIENCTDGLINTTYKIGLKFENSKNYFILQNVNTKIFKNPKNIQDNIVLISNFLKTTKYQDAILQPVITATGLTFIKIDTLFWRMFEVINNTYTLQVVNSPTQAYEVAAFLGTFHYFINQIDCNTIKPVLTDFINFENRIFSFQECLKYGKPERIVDCKDLIEFAFQNIQLPTKWTQLTNQALLPIRIIHADPKISNFLFDNQTKQPKAIIDWDTIMPGSVLYDFGDMVRSYCNLVKEDSVMIDNFSEEIFIQLEKGYTSTANLFLTKTEKDNLKYASLVVIYIQFLRFLTDYLLDDNYYQVSYSDQNKNRAINQMYLLKGLLKIK